MAERRRLLPPLAALLIPGAILAGLTLTPASRVSLALEGLKLDGLRVTFDSAGGFIEPVPMSEVTVLADIGRSIDSVVVILESGDRFALRSVEQLILRPADGAGPEATLQLSSMEIPPDSALEIQTEEDGTHRLFLPAGDPRALTLGGTWWMDTTLVDFGAIGISRIVVDTREAVVVDFRADESRGRALVLEDVSVNSVSLSRLRAMSDRAETTVRGGRIVSEWIEEELDASSRPSFGAFEGTIDSLWIEEGSVRAEIRGENVGGLSIAGRDRMPGVVSVLPGALRWTLLAALMGSMALGGVWIAAPALRPGRRSRTSDPEREESSPAAEGPSRRLAAVWFADIVGFTELSSRDEDGALAVSQELERLARRGVEAHGGRVVKLLGDGLLTEFASANAAVRAALGLQTAFSDCDVVRAKGSALRIGVHVCEVVATPDGDVYGSGVNIASRIESAAEPGRVAVSQDVAHQLQQRVEFALTPMAPVQLKGLEGPAQLFEVDWSSA